LEITDHIVNPENDKLRIVVIDEPGPGGAHHEYHVEQPDGLIHSIEFQNGPIGEVGVNGITERVLAEIIRHRYRSFQAGPFDCEENAHALEALNDLIACMDARTRNRMARKVEGTSAA